MSLHKPLLGELPTTQPNGLVGDWVMNEGGGNTIQDSSGNENTGTFVADAAWVPGRIGPAITFDGTGDYIDLGTSVLFDSSLPFTISAWVLSDSGTPSLQTIFTQDDSICSFYFTGSSLEYFSSTGSSTTASSAKTEGQWQHVAAVFDGVAITLYSNGVDVAFEVRDSGAASGALVVRIGRFGVRTDRDFNGQISSFKLHNRGLSASEVQQLYIDPFWYFRHDPIELWTAVTAGGAPAGLSIPIAMHHYKQLMGAN